MSINFDISESEIIKGVWIVKPSIANDRRGNIWTSFLKEEIEELLPEGLSFIHDKFSKSWKNVLRGIHGDNKSWKLVTCIYGKIVQVVVDYRTESPTFGTYESFIIDENNQVSILLPPRTGNAYYVKSDIAIYHYKLSYKGDYLDADEQFTLKWDDPNLNIKWPTKTPILSNRDKL